MTESEAGSTQADLEALRALQADAPELERIEGLLDRFNVFEAIGFVRQEINHSHFLTFLLDPKQNHGLGGPYSPEECVERGILRSSRRQRRIGARKGAPILYPLPINDG